MNINKNKYLIGVVIFIILALFSLFQALFQGNQDIVTMLITVIGFFTFMVSDRLEQAASIEKLQLTMQQFIAPLHNIHAWKHLLAIIENDTSSRFECQRLTSTKCHEYSISKVKSARRMYNTSFAADLTLQASPYYLNWLRAIVEGITEHNCIVHEVTLSHQRVSMVKKIFTEYGKPIKGSYMVFDLSPQKEALSKIPFVEFTVFENEDDSLEVIFGWTSSNLDFLGSDCFVVRDKHVAEYFLSYFRRIQSLTPPSYLDG